MRLLALPFFGLALVGCTQQVSPSAEQADVETSSSTTAVVGIARTTASEGTTAETVARFIRMRGYPTSDEALRAVGVTIESPAPGTCITFAPPDAAPAAQLIDVGAVTVEADKRLETRLIARQLPDVGDVVTGVGYGRTTDPGALPAGTGYVIHVAGSRDFDVPAFDAIATAPADPDVRVAGQDARGGVVLDPDQPVDVTWDPGRSEDVIYIDVAPKQTGLVPLAAVRCAFPDTGYAEVAGSLLGAPEGVIRVHRLHREAFRARGVDTGEMRFDFMLVATFVTAPRADAPVLR